MKQSIFRNILNLVAISGLVLAKPTSNYYDLEKDGIITGRCGENSNGEIIEYPTEDVDIPLDVCQKIYALKSEGIETENCIKNKEGQIESIDYYLYDDTSINEKILALKDLESFEMTGYLNKEYTLLFDGFTKLNDLNIKFRIEESENSEKRINGKFSKNGLKFPESLQYLTIKYADLNQENIDEITSLSNLEELELSFVNTDGLNLENFANCENLSSVVITSFSGNLSDNIIKNLKTIKQLTLNEITLNEKIIEDISSLTQLEVLKIQIDEEIINKLNIDPIKSLPNLKTFEINNEEINL